MLTVTDSGCGLHRESRIKLIGPEARLMEVLLRNLPRMQGVPFYLCEHGHTHKVCFQPDVTEVPIAPQAGLQVRELREK